MRSPSSHDDLVVERGHRRRDVFPGEEVVDAADRLAAEHGEELRVTEEMSGALRDSRGVVRRHEIARLTVADAELDPADVAAEHRGAAGHRLERRDPERLVPSRRTEEFRRV